MKKPKNRRIERAITTIKSRYSMGQEILKQCHTRSRGGRIQLLAKQFGINRDSAQKLRAMVDSTNGYTKKELNEWFRLFRRNGYALSISHFQKLLSVPKGKLRTRLTEAAVEFRWSSHRLQLEILSCLGRRRAGGRRPKVVSGDAFRGELERTIWTLDRWLTLHLEANAELDTDLKKQLRTLQRSIAKVDLSLLEGGKGKQ
ncbi:MAG: hypothetical protein J0M26_18980 [Planctomycetes bacterium]|nr:hypothetical protein [Planctomycetota bacterium]